MSTALPVPFAEWFAARGWRPHPHQLATLEAARDRAHVLLIAPTGGGKTLAGFLPSMIELTASGGAGLHTLYVSPLKALAVDVHRNVERPIAEMALPIRVETRTGDTPVGKRRRQRLQPPQILMTTPESLALLLSYADAPRAFRTLRCLIVDELHALADCKRGDLLALAWARLASLAPECRRVGLSATVAWPDALRAWLSPAARAEDVRTIRGDGGREPDTRSLRSATGCPGRATRRCMHFPPSTRRFAGRRRRSSLSTPARRPRSCFNTFGA